MHLKKNLLLVILLFSLSIGSLELLAQELYSAKGYWDEAHKETYQKILQKQLKGDSLNINESAYLKDYQVYLTNYFQRMSEEEKLTYEKMKDQWEGDLLKQKTVPTQQEFEWRPRDRVRNGLYGLYYGASIAAIVEAEGGAAAGIPLIMAGLWQLGPIINAKKYEGISTSTIRAGNAGKFLGLGYGLGLGLAISGDSENAGKSMLAFSTLGSIALGEIAFQAQKKKQFSEGHVEMMRHYGFLGPVVGLLSAAATGEGHPNLVGASIVGGGIAGLLIGNSVAKKYDYTPGDVDAISSFTWITTGLGVTAVVDAVEYNNDVSTELLLIPAATAVAGTILGQHAVRGAYLTQKQGSIIGISSGGAALIGLGVVALTSSESATVWVGVPTVLALITHQAVFHSFKMKNMEQRIKLGSNKKSSMQFSMKVMPENYFIGKQTPARFSSTTNLITNQVISFKLKF